MKMNIKANNKNCLDRLHRVDLNERNFHGLLGTEWLVESTIDVAITYLLRNKKTTSQFFLWCNSICQRLFHHMMIHWAKPRGQQLQELTNAQYQIIHLYKYMVHDDI